MARKNKEADKAYWQKYYAENREALREKRRLNYDREKNNEWHRKWLEKEGNREKWYAYLRERRKKLKLDKDKQV